MTEERAWERAHRAGAPVFYEEATDTVRTCPANYCMAVQRGGRWQPFVDAALGTKKSAIEKMIRRHQQASPEELVILLTALLAGKIKRR